MSLIHLRHFSLDVILPNAPDNHVKSGVIPCTLGDHYMVYTIVTYPQSKVPPRTVTCRDYKKFNVDAFLSDLNNDLSKFLEQHVDVDTACSTWKVLYWTYLKRHAPIREHRVKDRCNPWITREIMSLMYKRDYVQSQAVKHSSKDLIGEYKVLRNIVTPEIRMAQTNYYKFKIEKKNTGNSRCMWRTVKHLLGKSKTRCIGNEDLRPNIFNKHFATTGAKLSTKFKDGHELRWNLPASIWVQIYWCWRWVCR